MIYLRSCSVCSDPLVVVSGGKNTFFSGLSFYNSTNPQWIYWDGFRNEIFHDLDGSLTNLTGGGTLTPYKNHYNGIA